MNISDRFSPNALIRIRTWPGWGVGMGMSSIWSASGPPAERITAAFIPFINSLMAGKDFFGENKWLCSFFFFLFKADIIVTVGGGAYSTMSILRAVRMG